MSPLRALAARRLLFNDNFLQRLLSCDAVATGLCLTTAPCVLWATWSTPLSALRICNLKKGTTGVTPNDEEWCCDFNYVRRLSSVLCSRGAFLNHDLIKQINDKWQTNDNLTNYSGYLHFVMCSRCSVLALNWPMLCSVGTHVLFWQVSSGLRNSTWLLTGHGVHMAPAGLDYSRL